MFGSKKRQQKAKKAAPPIDTNDLASLLVKMPLFDTLTSEEMGQLKRYIAVIEVEKGEHVFEEGDVSNYVCFVIEGKLEVYKTDNEHQKVSLAIIPAGRCIGEMSLVDKWTRSATAVAATPACLVTLSQDNFKKICENHTKLGNKILLELARLMSMNLRKTSASFVTLYQGKS